MAGKALLPVDDAIRRQHLYTDDGDSRELLQAASRHKQYLRGLSATRDITINGQPYSRAQLLDSLDAFMGLVEEELDPEVFTRRLLDEFTIVQAAGRNGQSGQMLITGYYEPLFAASRTPTPPYIYPLYRVPPSLVAKKEGSTKRIMRREPTGTLSRFWTRAEIDSPARPLAGNELVYLRDPFEAFLLHIQGSGQVLFADGSRRPVRFAGHNGHNYRSIGKVLVDEGKMTLAESSIPAIRRYFEKNPGDRQRVLNENPRYIFFRWGNGDNGPRGSLGQPLTPGRSIAIDRKVLPDTLIGWLETKVPVVDAEGRIIKWRTSRRFVLPQDSGAAIKGAGRVDLFWGSGRQAAVAAGNMRQEGRLYFFIKK